MMNVTDLRNGAYYQEDGMPLEVMKYEHTKLGRGTATIKIKVKNLLNGAIFERSYISGKRVEEADVEDKRIRFMYRTSQDYVFEDEDAHQIELPLAKIARQGPFLKKGMEIKMLSYENRPLSIELPIKVSYRVKNAPPDARGNTVSNSFKEVLLENNLTVKAPMFVKTGDILIIDTRSGGYVERGRELAP